MRIVRRVDLRDQRLEASLEDHEVQVGGTEVVASRGPHQIADRAIDGNRIARRLDTPELKLPFRIGDETPAQIHLGLMRILIFVEALRRGMPDVDYSVRDGITMRI